MYYNPPVSEDGVIKQHLRVAFSTPTQLNLLKELGGPGRLIFMDAAFNVVRHGYGLLTLLVRDELDSGFPVAYCI